MPAWLPRALFAAVLGVPLGVLSAVAAGWWCLSSVEEGREPIAGQIHVRDGWVWSYASDHATGLRFYSLERVPNRLVAGNLTASDVPWWAEPRRDLDPPGQWRVGTLAVGWPWPAVARQWDETEPDRGFLPPIELDDDGSTIRRAALRFREPAANASWFILPGGAAATLALFSLAASAVAWVLGGRVLRRSAPGTA